MNPPITKSNYFWYGIYYGVASIVFFSLIYAINFALFGRFFMLMSVGIIILVACMILGGLAERKSSGGYLKYFDAFKTMFFIGLIGYILYLLFTIFFVNVIDKEYNSKLNVVIKESTMEWMEKYDVPEEKIEMQMNQMDKQMAKANTPFSYIKQVLGGAVMAAIFGLLCALFVKRNPPEGLTESKVLDSEV